MSFALEYRKKMQADARKAEASRKRTAKVQDSGFVVGKARKATDTRGNRRRMLAALSLAGIILSVFNSGALVHYAGGLGYNAIAMRVMILTEDWHRLMEENRMTALAENIRDVVTTARHSSWQDFAFGLDLEPTHPYLRKPETVRSDEPPLESEEAEEATPEAQPEMQQGPVMRASVGR